MDTVRAFLEALPMVASSPLGVVAFVVVVAAWLVIALRVKRNQQLLAKLHHLPERDRLKALRDEMGVVPMKGGLSPEQWLRSRIHLYLFSGGAVAVLAVVLMFVVVRTTVPPGQLRADVTPYQPEAGGNALPAQDDGGFRLINAFDGTGYSHPDYDVSEDAHPADRILVYDFDLVQGRIEIRPRMAYLELLRRGGPIGPTSDPEFAWQWQFPKLSIKVVNNSPHTALLSTIQLQVLRSTVDVEPVIVFSELLENGFQFYNDGWGAALDVQVDFALRSEHETTYRAPSPAELRTVALGDVEGFTDPGVVLATCDWGEPFPSLTFTDRVPPELRREGPVTMHGVIRYRTETGESRRLAFVAPIPLSCEGGFGAPAGPTYHYNVQLEAGRTGVTRNVAISQEIRPGDVDHFTLRVGSDRSAAYDLLLRVLDVSGRPVLERRMALDLFVPRFNAEGIAPQAAPVRFARSGH